MSAAASGPPPADLPPQWGRLERAVEDAAVAVGVWKRRALEAEAELARLRSDMGELARAEVSPDDLGGEVRRLRAENSLLQSRMLQARKRVSGLLGRLGALELDS